jgi:formamidopyrimidine-DNA glycosylase
MPEGLEAEYARRLVESDALDRRIERVDAPDAWFLKRGLTASTLEDVLPGRQFTTARRIGKLIVLDTGGRGRAKAPGPSIGLHLGMSGRILVDDEAAGDPLRYASNKNDPAWVRIRFEFHDGGSLALRDPRRLGRVELDPDEARYGPDVLSLRRAGFDMAVRGRHAPIKAVLMDQHRIAGLGNLLTDEALWRAGIDPARPASSLNETELSTLFRAIGTTVRTLLRRGGSHTGDHMAARRPGGMCPRDGRPLEIRTVGGRTTYSCPFHQH